MVKYNLKGYNSTLIVYEDRAVIKRGLLGRMATGGPSEKTMIYNKLSGLDYKGRGLNGGYISFVGSGLESTSGSFNANKNENTVVFMTKVKLWKEVADFINSKIGQKEPTQTIIQSQSIAEEIKKFKELQDSGIITESEFIEQKKKLLG
tara:strand:+ start:1324 stop:1770 length:447 start_codon:yes stop_codon:yes gene_type:complete